MSTFEITLQRKLDQSWPAVGVFTRPGEFLPVRTESRLHLDLETLSRRYDPRDYGEMLGKALFQESLRDGLARAQAQARDDQVPLRILLNVEAEDLKGLHWERLCAPLEGSWDYLCLNQATPFSRYLPSLTDRRYPPFGRRDLRALLLAAGPDDLDGDYGLQRFDIPSTLAALSRSFGDIPHDTLASIPGAAGPPTLEALCERLTAGSYALLHIVCHGRYNPKVDTILYLPDERRRPVTASQYIQRLSRLQGPRGLPHFTFLMSCESASPEAENGFGGLAQRLVAELGMPAVLAMSAPMTIQTGSELGSRFYLRLSEHGEVDRALCEALAGLMGRPDASVPAVFSRLGGRPLFSDALDRPLTASEIRYGLERLAVLTAARAPVLTGAVAALHPHLPVADAGALSPSAQQEFTEALATAHALSEEIADLSFNALAMGLAAPAYDPRCPFRGLASFRPEDRPFFFGREALVAGLLQRLEAHPFLALLGPSGSGKSSLALAGIVPALAQSMQGCAAEGGFAYLTPGAEPQARLAAALAAAPDCALVVIDQFEELFTLCREESQRAEFIGRMLELCTSHRVLLTMRADFWGDCAPYAALKDAMQAHQELVPPLDGPGLRRAIEQQAAAVGLRFEADLAEDILDEVQGEPGAMPLLQHALLLLWERRHGRWLRTAEYRRFGKVQQAIAHTADGIYLALGPAEQERMRAIFLRLTRLEEDPAPGIERRDTRRRVALDELVPAGSERGLTVDLVRRMADARLVVTGVNPVSAQEEVEVAHEALIRHWKRLGAWLEEDRAALRAGERVREAAQQWQESQRSDESLLVHRGARLDEALELSQRKAYAFNQQEVEYLGTCQALRARERQARERRRSQILAAALAAAVIFALLAGFGFLQSRAANDQAATATYALGMSQKHGTEAANQSGTAVTARKEAVEALDQSRTLYAAGLATQSQLLGDRTPQLRLLLALEASKVIQPEPPIVHRALREAIGRVGGMPLPGTAGAITTLAVSPDSRWLATGGRDHVARVWDLQHLDAPPILLSGHSNSINALAISSRGRWLATGSGNKDEVFPADTTVRVWDFARLVQDPSQIPEPVELTGYEDSVTAVAFSSDERWLATASLDATVRLWDTTDFTRPISITTYYQEPVNALAFSPDGRWLAFAAGDPRSPFNRRIFSAAYLWDLQDLQAEIRVLSIDEPVMTLAFSPDGSRLATGSSDCGVQLWDPQQADSVKILGIGVCGIAGLAFSGDGSALLAAGGAERPPFFPFERDDPVVAWRMNDLEDPELLGSPQEHVNAVAASPDGKWLAAAEEDGTVRLWHYDPVLTFPDPILLRGHDGAVDSVVFTPDSRYLISGGEDGIARLWNLTALYPDPIVLKEATFTGTSLPRFSPDGRWLAVYDNVSSVLVWDLNQPEGEAFLPQGQFDGVQSLEFTRDSRFLVAGGQSGSLRMWDLQLAARSQGQPVEPLNRENPHRAFRRLTFSPDGQYMASAGDSNWVFVWNVADWTAASAAQPVPVILKEHTEPVHSLAFTPDSRWLASGSGDYTIRIWDVDNLSAKSIVLQPLTDSAGGLKFSPDGRFLAALGLSDIPISVWRLDFLDHPFPPDAAQLEPVLLAGHLEAARTFAFSPDSRWLVSSAGVFDSKTLVWDLQNMINWTGAVTQTVVLQNWSSTDLDFSPEGRWLAADNRLFQQLVAGSEPLVLPFPARRIVNEVKFSPDGRWLAAIGDEGEVRLWRMGITVLQELACRLVGRNFTQQEWLIHFPGEPYRETCPQAP